MTRKKYLSFVSSPQNKLGNLVFSLFSDIDECTSKPHNCDRNALCKNTEGSFSCTCKPGYKRDGKKPMERSVKVNISVAHAIIAFSAFIS